ncbi:MAG: RHS repeat-associated core domain-containing protein [Bacteroidota bacterium]
MAVTASGHTDSTTYVNGFVYTNGVLDFFGSPEGRVRKNGSSYEYQYNITDHQGNTRILFTSAVQKVKATFETASQATEATQFLNYPSSSGINPVNTNNHTPGGSKSQLLNGGSMGLVGVANSYAVLPGDTVTIEAYARYDASTGSSHLSEFATYLLAAFNLPTPTGGETGTASSAINSRGALAAGGWGDGSTDSGHPKAFVNILIFDKNYNFLDVAYSQVTSSGSPAYIKASYTIKEAGYAFAYISNENPTYTDVFFDDVTITWANHVIQSNEYYPFGLQTANSWTRDGNKNNFLFNEGSELNTTSGLYDLDYRNYDATLGRFFQVDPLAIYDHSLSPFVYARNSPQVYTDPSGLMVPVGWSDAQARALYHRVGTTYSGSYEDWVTDADGGGAIGGGNGMGGGGGGSNGGYWEKSYNATWVPGRNPRYIANEYDRAHRDPGHWDFSETTVFVGGPDNNGGYEAGGEGPTVGSRSGSGSGGVPPPVPGSVNRLHGSYPFKKTGKAFTGQINGLGITAINSKTKKRLNVDLGPVCITIKPAVSDDDDPWVSDSEKSQMASDAFVQAWNAMTDEVDVWLNERGDGVTELELRSKVKLTLEIKLRDNSLTFSSAISYGKCLGSIPISEACYSFICDILDALR